MSEQFRHLTPEHKAALLKRLQQARLNKAVASHNTLRARPHGHELPLLSFAQQQLWLHERIAGAAFWQMPQTLYAVPLAMRVRGPLDEHALERSIQAIVQRHETLRTTFILRDGQPRQQIAATQTVSLTHVTLSADLAPDDLHAVIQSTANQPFDLEHGPLLRVTLFHLGTQEYLLLVTFHHVACDGWSRGIFFQELTLIYDAAVNHAADPGSVLPPLPVQYADYALWQREQQAYFAEQLQYWQQHLAGAPSHLELPTRGPRPPLQTFAGARMPLSLAGTALEKLKQLCQSEGCTLFVGLLAFYALLLMHYSQQRDLVIGVPIAHRTQSEIENLIGFFVNTLALRIDLSGEPDFRELLRRVRDLALQGFAHQDVPFEHVVEAMSGTRNLSHAPLFQASFVLQNVPMSPVTLAGLEIAPYEVDSGVSLFDLTLSLTETFEGLTGYFEYNRDLFSAETMTGMADHWHTLLAGVLAKPHVSVNRLPLLTSAEEQQLLTWHTSPHVTTETCLHRLFEARVARTPDAVAVSANGVELTYAQLNARANQVARALRRRGVSLDGPVGLFMERSLDLLAGLLGILKAGSGYLALDPAYPQARLTFMMQDAAITHLLTQEHLLTRLPDAVPDVLCLDRDWPDCAREAPENLDLPLPGSNLACILYTSGSTGQPKGIQLPHAGAVQYCVALAAEMKLTSSDRFLQRSTINFDMAIHEIFLPLLVGGTLIFASAAELLPGEEMAQFIRNQQITVCFFPPSALSVLPNDLPLVRVVQSAGEPCTEKIANRWADKHQLFNGYGPTECSIASTSAGPLAADRKPVLGHAFAGKRLYVADEHLNLVPIGVPGELYIGGPYLARGYLNRPDLTAERFLPDPWSAMPGGRMYCSGDLVSTLPDGTLDFLGRRDYQVKIRGYRVELEEIEAHLLQHPAIRACVVTAPTDDQGIRNLVAYVCMQPGAEINAGGLRGFLQQRLPEYMVPTIYVPLEQIPTNANGKVDRRALPDAMQGHLPATPRYVAPAEPDEQRLAEIWQEVLGARRVGLHDNFFDLGGHSLRLVQLQDRIQQTLQQPITLLELFQYPTISSCLGFLRQRTQDTPMPEAKRTIQEQEGRVRQQQRLALSRQRERKQDEHHRL